MSQALNDNNIKDNDDLKATVFSENSKACKKEQYEWV